MPARLRRARSVGERTRDWRSYLEGGPPDRSVTLVAERDGAVAGFAAHQPARDSDLDPARCAELRMLYVEPARWREGIGRALLEAAVGTMADLAYSEAALWVFVANERARRFYEAVGWRPEEGPLKDWNGIREVRYRLALEG